MKTASVSESSGAVVRRTLIAVELFVAATAVYGAVGLAAGTNAPPIDDLAPLGLPSWFWPGVALGVLIGGGAVVAAWSLMRGWLTARWISLAFATLLVAWLGAQIPFVGASVLQAVILAFAAAIAWLAYRASSRPRTGRQFASPA